MKTFKLLLENLTLQVLSNQQIVIDDTLKPQALMPYKIAYIIQQYLSSFSRKMICDGEFLNDIQSYLMNFGYSLNQTVLSDVFPTVINEIQQRSRIDIAIVLFLYTTNAENVSNYALQIKFIEMQPGGFLINMQLASKETLNDLADSNTKTFH